jgi:hypothetical protein
MHALNLASCKGVTWKYILGAKTHSMMLQLPSIFNLGLEHHLTHHMGHSSPYQGVCMLRVFCKKTSFERLFSILEWRMDRLRWIDCNVFIPRISCCGFFCLSVKATHTFDLFFCYFSFIEVWCSSLFRLLIIIFYYFLQMIYVLCIYNKKEKENQITVCSNAEPFKIFRTIWLYVIIIIFRT